MITIETLFKHIKFPSYQSKSFASILYLGTIGEKHLEKVLAPYNISTQQFRILRGLRVAQNEGVPIYNLGQFLSDPRSDTSRLVTRMQKAGWVERIKDKRDKRVINAVITTTGKELLAELDKLENDFDFDIGVYTLEQEKQLYELLQIMVDAVARQNTN